MGSIRIYSLYSIFLLVTEELLSMLVSFREAESNLNGSKKTKQGTVCKGGSGVRATYRRLAPGGALITFRYEGEGRGKCCWGHGGGAYDTSRSYVGLQSLPEMPLKTRKGNSFSWASW